MNFGLQREIYGLTPWMVDVHSFPVLTAMVRNFQNGVQIEIPEIKYNTPGIYDAKNDAVLVYDEWELTDQTEFEGIAIINLNGPITKNGGISSVGMEELSISMLEMSKDARIKGFIILTDSGGGSSCAVEMMDDAINEIKKTKPVYSLIKKGGMACSAAYGIISGSHKIFSDGEMNVVGSIGTMVEFCGKEANTEDQDGFKYIRIYATKSTMKNRDYEEALKGNYQVIVNDMLDPINDVFIEMIENNRPAVKTVSFDDGRTFFSKDAIGSLIDGVASFTEVVEMIQADALYGNNTPKSFDPSIINNSAKMTREQLKSEHPEVYSAIFQEGVTAENERVASWMVYGEADPEAVAAGIASGKEITPSQTQKLLVKMHSATMLAGLQSDSAKPVVTKPAATEEAPEADAVDAHYASIDARLGLTPEKK